MAELTREERQRWRETLEAVHSVDEFAAKLDELHEQLGMHSVTQHGTDFFRDSWIALKMARSLGADHVHLVNDERPDFALGWSGNFFAFEATEADRPDRRRGDEFKKLIAEYGHEAKLSVHVPYSSGMTPNQAVEWLELAAKRKADDRYDGSYGLVILLQPTDFNQFSDEVVGIFAKATQAAAPYFDGVWVLWKGVASQAWPPRNSIPPK